MARIRTHKSVNGEQLSGVRARQVVADLKELALGPDEVQEKTARALPGTRSRRLISASPPDCVSDTGTRSRVPARIPDTKTRRARAFACVSQCGRTAYSVSHKPSLPNRLTIVFLTIVPWNLNDNDSSGGERTPHQVLV